MLKEYISDLLNENNEELQKFENQMSELFVDLDSAREFLEILQKEKDADRNIFSPRTADFNLREKIEDSKRNIDKINQNIEYVRSFIETHTKKKEELERLLEEIEKNERETAAEGQQIQNIGSINNINSADRTEQTDHIDSFIYAEKVVPANQEDNADKADETVKIEKEGNADKAEKTVKIEHEDNADKVCPADYLSNSDQTVPAETDCIDSSTDTATQENTDQNQIPEQNGESEDKQENTEKNIEENIEENIDELLSLLYKKTEICLALLNGNKNRCRKELKEMKDLIKNAHSRRNAENH